MGRILQAAALSIVLLVFLALISGEQCSSGEQTDNTCMIGVYYYPWYGMDVNDHWLNDDIKGTPILGYYNSSAPTVANQHIFWAKGQEIDFFAVSWAGKGDWLDWDFDDIDYNLRNGFLKANNLSDFNFCLFYETVLVLENAINHGKNFTQIFVEDMNYALQYLKNPRYLRLNGNPVLFIYNVPFLYEHAQDQNMTVQDVHRLFDYVRQQLASMGVTLYIIGDMGNGPSPPDAQSPWLYTLNATTSYHFSDGHESWDGPLENAETFYPLWRSRMASRGIGFVPDVYPGSNNTNNRGVSQESWRVLPRSVTAFKQMLQTALNNAGSTPGFVMITSWNEWMENTQIEPSIEDGEVFLRAISEVIPEFPLFLVMPLLVTATLIITFVFKRKIRARVSPSLFLRGIGVSSGTSRAHYSTGVGMYRER